MDPLASAVADELRDLPPLPTVFFGHSMGAAVAYETLLRLEQAGAPVHIARLRVSGRSPGCAAGPAVCTDEEVAAARSPGGTHAAVFDDRACDSCSCQRSATTRRATPWPTRTACSCSARSTRTT
ncbi:thioesterase II family protein [Streptomyces sp. H62]